MAQGHAPPRRIKRLLVANRGEIATRIIQSARELDIETYTLFTANDSGHAIYAAHAIELPSPSVYLDVSTIVSLAKKHSIDAIHPGYGFLSESAELSRSAWEQAGIAVIGPGWEILESTGDKLAAKKLAQKWGIPTLPATTHPIDHVDEIRTFIKSYGLPVMLKAVDGGGGKGIRLVREEHELENAAKRAMAESPSGKIFVEKAAIDGFRHIEVQIVGDGTGQVMHLWERECSIQRRHQKIVELAPSTIQNREFVGQIIEAAMKMAAQIKYLSLGTFEFLANPESLEFFFLEINPRLQVEHTVTECISHIDIVKAQLEIAQGISLKQTALQYIPPDQLSPPHLFSVQLRLTAENVQSNWSLSIGKITSFRFPTGNGVRVDTGLVTGHPAIISADFDSLLAKIIVTGPNWHEVVAKSRRALEDTLVEGVKTNIDVLRAIAASRDFAGGNCDTQWLEKNIDELLRDGERLTRSAKQAVPSHSGNSTAMSVTMQGSSSSTVLLRKGDAWAINLAPRNIGSTSNTENDPTQTSTHHLKLTRILRNEFPSLLRAEVEYSLPGSSQPLAFTMDASASTATSGALMSAGKHRRGNVNDPCHVVIPFPGKLVEVLVDQGDLVVTGQVICVVRQMKMELEVRSKSAGRVIWVTEVEDGDDVAEGVLAAELEVERGGQTRARL